MISVPIWVLIFFAAYRYVEARHEAEQRREQRQMLSQAPTADKPGRSDSQSRVPKEVPVAD